MDGFRSAIRSRHSVVAVSAEISCARYRASCIGVRTGSPVGSEFQSALLSAEVERASVSSSGRRPGRFLRSASWSAFSSQILIVTSRL